MNATEFIFGDALTDATPAAVNAAKRSLLDLVGVAAAGRRTDASRIAHQTACDLWPAGEKRATLIFDGRAAGPAGAAFAGAATIDSMDAHDGYKPAKGHAGVAVLPGLLAILEADNISLSAPAFLENLILGYEIACRVATVQHQSRPDYHASGSWNAVGTAAVGARLLRLSADETREALGIAEYFGPRARMMRVIDHTTMVKDSSSWGAMTGVTAAYLAAAGFTGSPAETVETEEASSVWEDLGRRWLIVEQYFKLWPICRWAQPSVTAALELVRAKQIDHRQVRRIVIHTFHEARRLAGHEPQSTDEAQYAIAFPTACAFVRGRVGVDEVAGSGLRDSEILSLSKRISFEETPAFNAAFPARRLARLVVEMTDGRIVESPPTEPLGDPEHPLSDAQIVEKFHALAGPVLGDNRAKAICDAIGPLDAKEFDLARLLAELRLPTRDLAN
ncbi:MAG: MmgE/PrpD family protein [Pirellulales bacterium]